MLLMMMMKTTKTLEDADDILGKDGNGNDHDHDDGAGQCIQDVALSVSKVFDGGHGDDDQDGQTEALRW